MDKITEPPLRINGSAEICKEYGIKMGDNFIDTLTEPLDLKDFIENESRLEDGKRIVVNNPRFKSREITLGFTISGNTREEFLANKKAFLNLMYAGSITIQVPRNSDDVYHLVYTGKGGEYGMNKLRTFCHMVLKFIEPNPRNRI